MLTMRDIPVRGYERVTTFANLAAGLSGVIAIHSLAKGPASGGCRLWRYDSEADVLADALRLAKGMSFKNAMAGLPIGGGKAVLSQLPDTNREHLFEAFGEVVEKLGGDYVTAEDVGTGVRDMQVVRGKTRYVSGIAGGDPSPFTAMGVYLAMREAVLLRMGRPSLKGLTVAIQGVGNVGRSLCRLIQKDGGRLIIADVNALNLRAASGDFDASVERPDDIHAVRCDVFAPCALGASLDSTTVPQIRAPIICGAANNQLATPDAGYVLHARGVLYAPDYVVNAGGIINVTAEYLGWQADEISTRLNRIPNRLREICMTSKREGVATSAVADVLAAKLLDPAAQPALEAAL